MYLPSLERKRMKNLLTRVLEASINDTIWVVDIESSGFLSVSTIINCLDEWVFKWLSSADKTFAPEVGLFTNFFIADFNAIALVKVYSEILESISDGNSSYASNSFIVFENLK